MRQGEEAQAQSMAYPHQEGQEGLHRRRALSHEQAGDAGSAFCSQPVRGVAVDPPNPGVHHAQCWRLFAVSPAPHACAREGDAGGVRV